jgi:RNA polymerase sigma factor (sigma-70 family)
MATRTNAFIQRLRTAMHLHRGGTSESDGHLLRCFVASRDETVFAALVQRHGPMVWGVCRRLLNHHDAEDAFQAAFLVLFRKAASIRRRELLANWLYGVAHQTALQARRAAARRSARESQVGIMADQVAAKPDQSHELHLLLDQELSCLPARYRAVIVLCDLEGKTRKEAARQLVVPEGTVAGWLSRGRSMLAKRLRRQGLAISGGALALALTPKATSAGVPTSVVTVTIKAVALASAGQAGAPGAISLHVTALAEGVLKTMLLKKLQIACALLVGIVTLGTGAGLAYHAPASERPQEQRAAERPEEQKADNRGDQAPNAQEARKKAHHDLVLEWHADVAAGKTGTKLRWDYFAPRFMKEAEENAEDFVGCDSLSWIVAEGKCDSPEFAKAMALLTRHTAKTEQASYICLGLNAPKFFATASDGTEGLLREIMRSNPNPSLQAMACFCLAEFLANTAEFARVLRRPEAADLAHRVADCWGEEYLTQLKKVDPDLLARESTALFVLGRVKYAKYWFNHACLGKRAPETRGDDLEGKFMALSDYRGKVVALTFWAPWCVPCMATVPEERARVQRLAKQPFVMLGVVGKDDQERIKKTVQEKQINWRSWPDEDPERKGGPVTSRWNVHGWGGSFILDQHGVIRYMDTGGTNMDFAIDALLIALEEDKAAGHAQPTNQSASSEKTGK